MQCKYSFIQKYYRRQIIYYFMSIVKVFAPKLVRVIKAYEMGWLTVIHFVDKLGAVKIHFAEVLQAELSACMRIF